MSIRAGRLESHRARPGEPARRRIRALTSRPDTPPFEIDAFLREARVPLRLAILDADGAPRVLSLWYLWQDGALWCATSPKAWVIKRLRADPRCGFEVAGDAPPYRGVRGRGRAELDADRGPAILEALVDRYLGSRETRFARWLLARSTDELAIRIVPEKTSHWDYSRRMA